MTSVKNLTCEYPGVRALDRISFTISPGSITALVGPNGAGKTTLLQCLAALIKPFDGQILIGDLDQYANNLLILNKGRLVDREMETTATLAGGKIHIEITRNR